MSAGGGQSLQGGQDGGEQLWSRWQAELYFSGAAGDAGRDADQFSPEAGHGASPAPIAIAKRNLA